MKKMNFLKIIITVCILFFSITVYAQLKVHSNGNVSIGPQFFLSNGSKLEVTGKKETLEARIFSSTANIARIWTINSINAFSFGLGEKGYGHIYSNLNAPNSIMTFDPKGNFGFGRIPSFKLDVNGNIRVNSIIHLSDNKYFLNVKDINKYQLNNLSKLRTVTYNLDTKALEPDSKNNDGKTKEQNTRAHYGFVAQEVKEIYPELVYVDREGTLGIDYVSFIPLLLEEVKQQREDIKDLKVEIEKLKNKN